MVGRHQFREEEATICLECEESDRGNKGWSGQAEVAPSRAVGLAVDGINHQVGRSVSSWIIAPS
jgi:hypothetical protein